LVVCVVVFISYFVAAVMANKDLYNNAYPHYSHHSSRKRMKHEKRKNHFFGF